MAELNPSLMALPRDAMGSAEPQLPSRQPSEDGPAASGAASGDVEQEPRFTNISPTIELLPDKSIVFENSVRKAMIYYITPGNRYEHVKVFSNSQGKWYHNPFMQYPTEFIEDFSDDYSVFFNYSVSNAVEWVSRNAFPKPITVFDRKSNIWFDNAFTCTTKTRWKFSQSLNRPECPSPAKILFFDVDGTLIKGHTDGQYHEGMELRDKVDHRDLAQLKKYLQQLQDRGYILFINSRGRFDSVVKLLIKLDIHLFFMSYDKFNEADRYWNILAANMPETERVHFKMTHFPNHDIVLYPQLPYETAQEYHRKNSEAWAVIKTHFIKHIAQMYQTIYYSDLYFFDDTNINILNVGRFVQDDRGIMEPPSNTIVTRRFKINSYLINNSIPELHLNNVLKNNLLLRDEMVGGGRTKGNSKQSRTKRARNQRKKARKTKRTQKRRKKNKKRGGRKTKK